MRVLKCALCVALAPAPDLASSFIVRHSSPYPVASSDVQRSQVGRNMDQASKPQVRQLGAAGEYGMAQPGAPLQAVHEAIIDVGTAS